jgi:glutathione S-transferase
VGLPVLWHIPVSHYNEKVRWALDLKGVEHERRAPPPPAHIPVARWLTRGRASTFPLLVLDGQAIADSTAIIAALERRHPDPPLYPEDPAQRARALELEEFFDEELGPHVRGLAFHEMRKDPAAMAAFAGTMLRAPLAGNATVRGVAGSVGSVYSKARYRVRDAEDAAQARAKVVAALDRLEAEVDRGGGEYLVGDAFSVADLTAASLFVPVVNPREGPELPELPEPYRAFVESLRERRGFRWVQDVFARHRVGARRP